MAWIKMIAERDAQGDLKEMFDRCMTKDGAVDNILKIHSLNPASLKGHFEFYRMLMFGRSELKRAQREMIAVVVSAANNCHY